MLLLEEKIIRLNTFTDSIYHFCLRHNISAKSILRYALLQIKLIKNKLYQLTLILCWINIISEQQQSKNIFKMLKLVIYIDINVYIKNDKINDVDSLHLLHLISKIKRNSNIKETIIDNMCKLDQPHNKHMKNIIIKRFLFFLTYYNDENSFLLRYIIFDQQKFEITWTFVKYCLLTLYKIVDMSL